MLLLTTGQGHPELYFEHPVHDQTIGRSPGHGNWTAVGQCPAALV